MVGVPDLTMAVSPLAGTFAGVQFDDANHEPTVPGFQVVVAIPIPSVAPRVIYISPSV